MAEATLAGEVKDWLTSVGIVVGGIWAIWRFGYQDWLRRRAELPTLEGSSVAPELTPLDESRLVVSLRWSWRNCGTRPVYINDNDSVVYIYELSEELSEAVDPEQQEESEFIDQERQEESELVDPEQQEESELIGPETREEGEFIDPRQQEETLERFKIGTHYPLKGFGFYMLEPGTNSSLLTVPILPTNKAFIARMVLIANSEKHPTGGDWDYSWERWQVFRTDLKPGVSNLTPVPASPSGIKS